MSFLPATVLPTGTLELMRAQAQAFMRQSLVLYNPTLAYDTYGTQVVTSGIGVTVSGYVGAVRGTDKDLLIETMQSIVQRDGVEIRSVAIVLLPFETVITNQYVIHHRQKAWNVIWNSNDTMDAVQIYTKALIAHITRKDETIT